MRTMRTLRGAVVAVLVGVFVWPAAVTLGLRGDDSDEGPSSCYKNLNVDGGTAPDKSGCSRDAFLNCIGSCTRTGLPSGTVCELCVSTYAPWKQCYYTTQPRTVWGFKQTAPCVGAILRLWYLDDYSSCCSRGCAMRRCDEDGGKRI